MIGSSSPIISNFITKIRNLFKTPEYITEIPELEQNLNSEQIELVSGSILWIPNGTVEIEKIKGNKVYY